MFAHHRRLSAAAFMLVAAFGAIPTGGSCRRRHQPRLRAHIRVVRSRRHGHLPAPGSTSREQATAFIESWYFASIYGTLTEQKPPASLPKCTFVARDRINGGPFQFHAFYVSQGKQAWVGLPAQVIGPGAYVPVQKWYVATPRATPAWLGKLDPLPKTAPTTTTTTKPATVVDRGSSDSSAAPWIIAGVAAVALIGVGAVVVRNRRRAAAS